MELRVSADNVRYKRMTSEELRETRKLLQAAQDALLK